ncbi:MAG: hypothetical protein M9921_15755 [Fimbriimonadaceae bacterium]|nr:hypothetical protein [Fimbriimonadaceae bacterium]
MKKRRGHYCWVCGRVRPNEKFSGAGHRDHICKECVSMRRRELRAGRSKVEGSPDNMPMQEDQPSAGC